MSSYVPIKPKLVDTTSHEDFCKMDGRNLMFLFELEAVNTLPASEVVVIPSKKSCLQPMATNSVQVSIEADGSTINHWMRVFVPSTMTEPSCDHDKVSDSDNMTFNSGSLMLNQLNTANKLKPIKFKFLIRVINGNITININISSITAMDDTLCHHGLHYVLLLYLRYLLQSIVYFIIDLKQFLFF